MNYNLLLSVILFVSVGALTTTHMHTSGYVQHLQAESIEPYDDKRDGNFIAELIERNKEHFPDAYMAPDFKSEHITVVLPTAPEVKQQFPHGVPPLEIERQKVFVYTLTNKPVGFVRTWIMAAPASTAKAGVIVHLAVTPEQQQKGYGKKLLDFALADLKNAGAQTVVLGSTKHNIRAHKLYEKSGFVKYGELPDQLLYVYTVPH